MHMSMIRKKLLESDNAKKEQIKKMQEVVIEHGFDLEQIYSDQNPQFFSDKSVQPDIAKRFVSEMSKWVEVEEYSIWQQSRTKTEAVKENIRKARNLAFKTTSDLKKIHKDRDPNFFIKEGIREEVAYRFIFEITKWEALKGYNNWQKVRPKKKAIEKGMRRAQELALVNSFDLEQINSDQNPDIFITNGISPKAARRFVSEISKLVAVEEYSIWQQCREEGEDLKQESRKARDLAVENGLDLEQIHDKNPEFFIGKGVKMGVARRFVSEITEWERLLQI
ncbi:unnamed protein product [Penicillium pancosmium]